jgi:hypothetical protein
LLINPGSVNPLAAGFDPINLRVDTAKQELNPTLPAPIADLTIAPKTVDALLDRPLRGGDSGRSSLLEGFNTRMLGNSSLAPAVAPPAEVKVQERPLDFGQFPSRKF